MAKLILNLQGNGLLFSWMNDRRFPEGINSEQIYPFEHIPNVSIDTSRG